MTPLWTRLEARATELVEVRWVNPVHARQDVMVRRFRRRHDAIRFADALAARGITQVRVHVGAITRWRELPVDGEWWT